MSRLSPNMHAILKSDIIQLLNGKQIYTVLDFVRADTKLIEKTTRLSFREVLDLRKELIKRFSAKPRNAFDYYRDILSQSAIVGTGIKNLDELLEGGLFTGNIYEICGLPANGKTLLCLTVIKNIISKSPDTVYYLDTKGDFSARKLKHMLNLTSKEDLVDALKRILVKKTNTRNELIGSIFEIKEKIQQGLNLRLVIIDSLPPLYWQSESHSENNHFLNHMVNYLRYLTVECNVVVIVTNLITLWNEGNFNTQDSLEEKISCGGYWRNIPNVRLKFMKENTKINVTLLKTWNVMPEVQECCLEITEFGIV